MFEEQVRIAVDLGKPLFCHEREAHSKFLEVSSSFHLLPFLENIEAHMIKNADRGFPRPRIDSSVNLPRLLANFSRGALDVKV